ncbi:MAG TPA: cytochrome c peroxidase [Bacteroidia bacterium]|nr:cytochrome c peroxidase [Bacteroidia bacterium]
MHNYFRKVLVYSLPLGIIFLMSVKGEPQFSSTAAVFKTEMAKTELLRQKDSLNISLNQIQKLIALQAIVDSAELRFSWRKCREYYRTLSPFMNYLNPELALKLNGPPVALPEEEDEVAAFLQPHGLQVIEEKLFPDTGPMDKDLIMSELGKCLVGLDEFEKTVEDVSLTEAEFYQAIGIEILRYFTMVVTEIETPKSKLAFYEGAYFFRWLPQFIVACYPGSDPDDLKVPEDFGLVCSICSDFLEQQQAKPDVDYFTLYSDYYIPLSEKFSRIFYQRCPDFPFATGPVNFLARSVFDPGAFNVGYFLSGGRMKPDAMRADLGRLLFFDPALSANDQRSCASCHQPGKAFTDGLPKSLGSRHGQQLLRNAPTLINAVLQRKLFHDGRAFTFENQASEVLNNPDEMQSDFSVVPDKIKKSSGYIRLFKRAFSGTDDTIISNGSILKAIAAYEETLVAMNSRFDKAIRGEPDVLSLDEKSGFNLFMGKAECGTCHFVPLFNGTAPPEYIESELEVLGVPGTADTLNPVPDNDFGRERIIPMPEFRRAFKTPTVRNVEITAPYMHNGIYTTLTEVIDFYNRGGGEGMGLDIPNQTLSSHSLNLNEEEKGKLRKFLASLTDTTGCTEYPKLLPAFDLSKDKNERIVGEPF